MDTTNTFSLGKYKKEILIPLITCIVAIILIFFLTRFMKPSGNNILGMLTDGQKFLDEMKYDEAIAQFSSAIQIDPNNKDARMGLAKAYIGKEDYGFAQQILEELTKGETVDKSAADELVDVYLGAGQPKKALKIVKKLVDDTDEDQYYDREKELVKDILDVPHLYASGTDQELIIREGSVLSRGSNTLGQLGTDKGLGNREYSQKEYAPANFDGGKPHSVFCAGRTSLVLDENHNLWASGENRWGQMGLSYGTTLPESGWQQILSTGDVAYAAGSTGRLFIVKMDGSLWVSGLNGGAGQNFSRVESMPTIIKIITADNIIHLLGADGTLYELDENTFSNIPMTGKASISRIVNNISDFCMTQYGDTWLDETGGIHNLNYSDMPENWQTREDGSLVPDFIVKDMASNHFFTFLLDSDGHLRQVTPEGQVKVLSGGERFLSLSNHNGTVSARTEKGETFYWQEGSEGEGLMPADQ
ncbi:MAG: tetratricopeptide repeat protein [Lachnospiraceae bacterium]|nr:tetratricopeptide repeat protein [Lachnospiraceae bacterium]